MATNYERAFDDAASELGRILNERNGLDVRITELRKTLFGLSNMLREHDEARQERLAMIMAQLPASSQKLTDVVRDVVYYAGDHKLTAQEIRDSLIERAPEFSEIPQLLATVHSTLKRLTKKGELESKSFREKDVYWWAGPRYGGRTSLANMLARPSGMRPDDWEESLRLSRTVQKFVKTGKH
jgi:hypothetical protein